jgi:hypothetical protein
VEAANGVTVARSPSGASVTTYAPDAQGRRRVVAIAPNGATAIAFADADEDAHHRDSAMDTAVQMKVLGLTPQYVVTIRSASPALRNADVHDLLELKAVGVTPDYVRDLAREGFSDLDADTIKEARAMGVTPGYIRAVRATGAQPSMDEFVELRALAITPEELARVRGSGPLTRVKIKQLIKSRPPAPPVPPAPPSPDEDG